MTESPGWSEENSRFFIDYARYFVPDRESQIRTLCRLIPDPGQPFRVLELASGDGSLAGAVLERYPNCTVYGWDGSHEMLDTARRRLAAFGDRFQPGKFDLAERDWRQPEGNFQAVISSLAIHHLEDDGKRSLFREVFPMLAPGGIFLIADIIRPAGPAGMAYAAAAYDDAVRRQSIEIDGNLHAYEQFNREQWNFFRYPDDPVDKPSTLFDQLNWLAEAGFEGVDTYWLRAGHAIFGGTKPLSV